MKTFFNLFFLLFTLTECYAQAPSVEAWDKRFGGTDDDEFFSFARTSDGGYILGSQSQSPPSGNKTQDCRGGYDYWIVKIDSSGNKQWDKRFGTDGDDLLWCVEQTNDGGYMLGGFTGSGTGFDKTVFGYGGYDIWLVKIDAEGNIQWNKDFGGTDDDYLPTIKYTRDGGYILGSASWSSVGGDKTEPNWDPTLQTPDYWIIKVDSAGNKQWDKDFGGGNIELLTSIIETSDGGYLAGGTTQSDSGDDISQSKRGDIDYWIVKVDNMGNKLWDKRFGGSAGSGSTCYALLQTADGNYLVGGSSSSDIGGDKSQNSKGNDDYWILKIDTSGNKLWDKDFGGPGEDELVSMSQTDDGGYLFSGNTIGGGLGAGGDKSENNLGEWQVWIIKTDSLLNKQWDKTILVGGFNNGGYAIQIDDNCYTICQQTPAGISGYKTQTNWDSTNTTDDLWIVKFCFTGTPEGITDLTNNLQLNIYPNPFSNEFDITIAKQGLTQANFTLTNMLGQQVYTQQETNLNPTYTKMLDLSYLPNGIYLLQVVVDGQRVVREVVKQ